MQNTTADYKLEINKPSRSFECKITIGDNIYNNEDIVNMTFDYLQANEGFSIGNTISQSLDLTLLNKGDIIYSTSNIKVEIGLMVGSKFEYILMGIFNIDEIEKTDYTTKFTAYDNMIKFEVAYFSDLGDKPTLQQVVNELEKKTGVQFIGSLPSYTVSKLDGFSCREVLSYVASICGGNALITRDGKFTVKVLSEVEKSIDGNNYFDYTREEVKYKIGQITCQVDESNTLSKGSIGTDSMELQFENTWITESILNDIYNKLKSVEYLGYSMKWQGDISLDPFDIITVTDVKNVTRKIPILSQDFSYTGGLTSDIGAKGETKNKNSFSSNGSTTNKVNRVVMEQAVIKEALIEKANIKDLEVSNAKIENLQAKTATIENAIIGVAYIKDLTVINANIDKLIANDVTINNALINKADITELNAVSAKINVLEADSANIKDLLAGNLTGENIQAGGITSDKLTIANGFITNAMIANLDVLKLNAGDISTNKFRIVSDNGGIEIVGATQQFKDKNNKVRIQMGQDVAGNFNFILRGEDGTSTLIDHTGIKPGAIADGLIVNDMIGDGEIGGKKIDISSMITEINKDNNTSIIKSSKVQLDTLGQTLEVAFNSLKTQSDGTKSLTESHSTTINIMQGQISTAINNTQIVKDGQTILLKDDYNRTVSKVNSINSTIGTHKTLIDANSGNITSVDTKVNTVQRDLEGTKSTVSSHTSQINGLNSTVSTQGSSITQLQNKIALKVEKSDITTAINNIDVGNRNLVKGSSNILKEITMGEWNSFPYAYTLEELNLQNDDDVSFRLYLKFGNTICGGCARVTFYDKTGGNIKTVTDTIFIKSNSGGYSSVITKIPANTVRIAIGVQREISGSGSATFKFNIKEALLIKGNKLPTGWTPAPEDIDTSINNVDSKLTTTSNKVASIETALDSITQRVSSTETTTSTINATLTTTTNTANTAKSTADTAKNNAQTAQNTANSAKDSATNANNKIDNFETGGVNLLIQKNIVKGQYLVDTGTTTSDPNWFYTDYIPVSKIKNLTTGGYTNLGYSPATCYYNSSKAFVKGIRNANQSLAKLITIDSGIAYVRFSGMIRDLPTLKIEKGIKATSYSPAPEDIDSEISTVKTSITTTNSKVASIETNLTNITSRVSATETTTTTINGNVTNLQSRMNTAEQKITSTAIINTISETINNGSGSINTVSTVLDRNGLTVNNGAIRIRNNSGTNVLEADVNGNLILTGTAKSQSGDRWVGLDSGGLTFQDYHRNEQMLRVALSSFSSARDMNGVSFALPQYSDYLRFQHIAKSDLSNGWTSSDTSYTFMDMWSGTHTINGYTNPKGITVYSPLYAKNKLNLYSGNEEYPSTIEGGLGWSGITGMLGLAGDNGCFLGYKSGSTVNGRLILTEAAHPGTGDHIRSYGNWNASANTIHNAHLNGLSLTVSGSKNCIQKTKNYGERLINAYETAEYYFGDIGSGKINGDGECLIYIDDIFQECVNTDIEYHVFTQVYNGAIKTIERFKTYFVIKGDPGTNFSWELKAKRLGYENNRLDVQDDLSVGESGLELFGEEDFKVNTSEELLNQVLDFNLEDLLLMEG